MTIRNTAFLIGTLSAALLSAGPLDSTVVFTSSNLPIVLINTHGQAIVNEPKITADMGIIDNGPGKRNTVSDSLNSYNGKIGIEIRGSSSQMFPKKQFSVETRDSSGISMNVSLLGFPSESDWILSAQYNDKTLMRDALTYTLSGSLGRYASRTKYCEVVINGEYMGVYVLFEKIKRDKNRVNVSKLDTSGTSGDALTGGYIIKIDKLDGSGNAGWNSTFAPYTGAWQKILYQYHYPKPEDITELQKTYIKNYILNFEANMMLPNYTDTVNGYTKILDVNSAVDYFITNELTKNVDGFRLSFYLYKDKDSKNTKLFLGPVWDYSNSLGNCDYYTASSIPGWQLTYLSSDPSFQSSDGFQPPFWWNRLLKDTIFMNKVRVRWTSIRKNEFSINRINKWIDSVSVHLSEAQPRNFKKWPILSSYVWPNAYIGGTYEKEIIYLKKWISDRINWMDIQLTGAPLRVSESDRAVKEFNLFQNFPNPFNPATTIEYQLAQREHVTLTVCDILGKQIALLTDAEQDAGVHHIQFNSAVLNVSSGVYFYQLHAGAFSARRKMVILK